jgi:predicted dehydrogenase
MTGASCRLGLVGFGRLARDYYMPAFRALGRRDRLVVADPSAASREAALSAGVAAVHETHDALLQGESLDGLLVASPPSTHFAVWRAAAARAVPVFMEKPFLLPGDLARIAPDDPACDRLMLNFNRRFWPNYQALGPLLRAGRIGRPLRARFTLRTNIIAWSTVTRHRLDQSEGGALYDLGNHVLDLVAITFGAMPATIEARQSDPGTAAEAVEIELHYESGLTVLCDLAYADRNQETVLIEGEAGQLRLEEPNARLWCETRASPVHGAVTKLVDVGLLGSRFLLRDRSMLRASLRASLASFIATLGTGGPFTPGFKEARRVALWSEAATRSIASGKPEPISGD